MSTAEGEMYIWAGEQERQVERRECVEVERKGLRNRCEEVGMVRTETEQICARHYIHLIMKNEFAVRLLDSDGEDRVTPATVLVHVMAAHSPVGLPLSHQLVHLQEREKECRQGE
jgi:hypothetical protein